MTDSLPTRTNGDEPEHVPQPGDATAALTPAQMEDARLVSVVKAVGPPPPLVPHPTNGQKNFGDKHKLWVTAFLASVPSPSLAAQVIGLAPDTLYYHRRRDPEFRRRWDQAMADAMDTLMGAAAEEALGIGEQYVVTKDGVLMTVPKERNDKLLAAFLLRESKVKHEREHSGGVIIMPAPMSEETWEEMVLKQQAPYRETIPGLTPETPITDAIINARKPVVIEGAATSVDTPDNMPKPPDPDAGSVRLKGSAHDLTKPAGTPERSSGGVRVEKPPETRTTRRTVRTY